MTIETLKNEIEYQVNTASCDNSLISLAEGLTRMHRTRVQSFCGSFILPYIKIMSDNYDNGNYDLRNKEACEMCNVMWKEFIKKYPWMNDSNIRLPFI